jgi:hypothetical protein
MAREMKIVSRQAAVELERQALLASAREPVQRRQPAVRQQLPVERLARAAARLAHVPHLA